MILIDTNVLSEMMKTFADRSANVVNWLRSQDIDSLWVSSTVYAELLSGLRRMPEGARRAESIRQLEAVLFEDMEGRILPFDASAAEVYAEIALERRRRGLSAHVADIQIAAVAKTHGFAVATRNIADFGSEGLIVINPWDHPAA